MKKTYMITILTISLLSITTFSWGFGFYGNKDAEICFGSTRTFVNASDKISGYVELSKNKVLVNSVKDNLSKKIPKRLQIIGDLASIISGYDGDIINLEGTVDNQKKGLFAPKSISFIIPGEYIPKMQSFTSYILTNSDNMFYIYDSNKDIALIGPAAQSLSALFPSDPSNTLKQRVDAGISPSRATSISKTKLQLTGVYSEKDGKAFLFVKKISIPDMQIFKFYDDLLRIEGSERPIISDDVNIFLCDQ